MHILNNMRIFIQNQKIKKRKKFHRDTLFRFDNLNRQEHILRKN